MHFNSVVLALSALSSAFAAPAAGVKARSTSPVVPGFSWSDTSFKIRGVNIGGWLVLEPWITPSIFQSVNPNDAKNGIVDEFTLCQTLGQAAAKTILTQHWASWATEDHFRLIKQYGFNLVRIPIGFWAIEAENTPYVMGAQMYLDYAISWARKHNLMVMIDLHGAPGSQNGFDNSGRRMPKPRWQSVDPGAKRTLRVLEKLQAQYGAASYDDVIAGIELLNEPLIAELNFDKVKTFERKGYNQQRATSQSRVVVIQDGYSPPSTYNGFLTPSDNDSQNVVLDHHEYQVFTNDLVGLTHQQHQQAVCSGVAGYTGSDKWTVVGEWSGAMTDCAFALNGYGRGARYDGTYPGSSYHGSCKTINSIETWTQELKDATRRYIEAQLDVYEKNVRGWIFWNFRTEGSAEWDMMRLVKAGVFPQPLTARKFSPTCS